MFFIEMKRRLYTKYTLFSMVGILIITIGLNLSITNDSKYIEDSLEEEAIYEGDITEDNLLLALIKVRDEKSDKTRYTSQISIINSLTNIYPGILYTENKVRGYPDELGGDFYQSWENKFKTLIKLKLSPSDQEIALKKLNEVKTPFVRYPGYYLYFNSLEHIQIIFMIILLLVTFFAAGTYSDSFEDESMEIIRATKGYKKNMFIRIVPSIFYGVLMTFIVLLITIGMTSSIVGLKVLKSSFKMIALFSFGNFSIYKSILIIMLSEIIGIVTISTLMGYVSMKTKETTKGVIFGVSISLLYMIGGRMISSSKSIINGLLNLIPIASSNILNSISGFSFHFGIWEPYVVIIGSLIMFILSMVALIICIMRVNKMDLFN